MEARYRAGPFLWKVSVSADASSFTICRRRGASLSAPVTPVTMRLSTQLLPVFKASKLAPYAPWDVLRSLWAHQKKVGRSYFLSRSRKASSASSSKVASR